MKYRKSKRKQQNHLFGAIYAHIESMEDRVLLAGELGYLEALKDGVSGVDGVNFVAATDTSPDGKHVYSVGGVNNIGSGNEDDNAIAVFSRDSATGQLTYLQSLFDDDDTNNPGTADGLLSGRDVKVSPDGKHVYTAGSSDDAVGIFSRDASTGLLTYVSAVFDGIGTDGLNGVTSIALSPDGTSLYVAGRDDDAVAVFSRNSTTGALTFVQSVFNNVGGVTGLDRILSVKVSPDGKHVYTAAGGNRNFTGSDAIGVFERNQSTGVLTFVDSYFEGDTQGEDTISGLDELTDLVLSPDGSFLYAASHGYPQGSPDPWIAIFTRNDLTGELTWTSVVNTFDLPANFPTYSDPDETSLVLSQDGAFMYATIGGQVVRMARDAGTGNLTYDSVFAGLDNLAHLYAGYDKISIDPSGRHLYVPDKATDSVIVLTTDLDFGDAPDPNYATLRANDGARHVAVGPMLGAGRDIDLDGQFSDDGDGNDDEDGLVNPTGDLNLVRGVAPSVDVLVNNTYGQDATLFGWIDFNGDGIFDNATEQASVVVANGTVDGVVTLEFPKVPADAVLGQTAARFRISTDYAFLQSPSPIGAASDGEVEDYTATIRSTGVLLFDPGTGRWRMGTSDGTSFMWTNGPKWNPTAGWTTFTGDYNGDGLTDGIGITSQNAVFFARNNGDGTMSTVSAGSFSSLESFQHIMVGDFNGDGRDDLIVQQATNNTTPLPGSWFVKAWNGSTFTTSFFGRWEAADWVGFGVGDVNQDGVADIIGVRNADGMLDRVNWLYGISNVIPDTSRRLFAQFAGAFNGRQETSGWVPIVGDWDGDGRTDVAARKNDGRFVYGTATGGPTPFAAIGANRLINSTGPLFSPSAFMDEFLVGDFNGDGRDDLMTRQSNNRNLWVAPSSTSGPTSSTAELWGSWNDATTWSRGAVGDFNGDGLADYVSVDLATSHAWVSRSTASAFLPAADFGLITGPEALVGPLNLWHSIVS